MSVQRVVQIVAIVLLDTFEIVCLASFVFLILVVCALIAGA
jgi:hypothetical protein